MRTLLSLLGALAVLGGLFFIAEALSTPLLTANVYVLLAIACFMFSAVCILSVISISVDKHTLYLKSIDRNTFAVMKYYGASADETPQQPRFMDATPAHSQPPSSLDALRGLDGRK